MHLAESAVLRCNRCCLWLFYGLRIISHGLYCRCWVLCHMSSSLPIPNVYLTPHASRCDESDRPAQSWCSVRELDACTHVHQCVGMFPLKITLCQNNMTLREFKHSEMKLIWLNGHACISINAAAFISEQYSAMKPINPALKSYMVHFHDKWHCKSNMFPVILISFKLTWFQDFKYFRMFKDKKVWYFYQKKLNLPFSH